MSDDLWRPEADESVLQEIAASINKVFGRNAYASAEGSELIIQFGGISATIGADGRLLGASSIPPNLE